MVVQKKRQEKPKNENREIMGADINTLQSNKL